MRIAFDTGGTFTDCVFLRDGCLEILKVPSTPHNPAEAIRSALQKILGEAEADAAPLSLLCGTTVGTNALIERRGARVALVTTAGFEDVLEIGRQARPKLFDLFASKPAPLVHRELRLGLRERIGADGKVLLNPSTAEFAAVAKRLRAARVDSVALCLLFSFLRPEHERLLARHLRARGFSVSVSHEILPEFREFERTSTTVANAYLVPVMSGYLAQVEQHARQAAARERKRARRGRPGAAVRIMQSSGGILSGRVAAREPVRTILSGPAGGVLGAQQLATRSGHSRVISFDMGGTSTDVSLIENSLRTTNESVVAGLPVAIPMLEIHTVGAGGGSIARFDRGGSLRVGPESAGADPGPICYGRGERPTVTDANLLLGRLGGQGLLGGEFSLDAARAARFMHQAIRGVRGMRSVEEFAQGILDVVEATMERAIRVISVERGRDPRDFTLVAFGGAGGLHACNLAESLSMSRVLVPKLPGALSALGIFCADAVKDFSRTVLLPSQSARAVAPDLRRAFAALEREGKRAMRREGFDESHLRVERSLDMRYVGQAYELNVPFAGDFLDAFHREHETRYAYADTARPAEVVNVRARFVGPTPKVNWPKQRLGKPDCRDAISETRQVFFRRRTHATRLYTREKLRPGNRFRGPAIVSEYSATTVVPPGWLAHVDGFDGLILSRSAS